MSASLSGRCWSAPIPDVGNGHRSIAQRWTAGDVLLHQSRAGNKRLGCGSRQRSISLTSLRAAAACGADGWSWSRRSKLLRRRRRRLLGIAKPRGRRKSNLLGFDISLLVQYCLRYRRCSHACLDLTTRYAPRTVASGDPRRSVGRERLKVRRRSACFSMSSIGGACCDEEDARHLFSAASPPVPAMRMKKSPTDRSAPTPNSSLFAHLSISSASSRP